MKGILINPFDETIKEVMYSGNFREIYDLIDCRTFTVVRLNNVDDMFVDDEGLLIDNRYFTIGNKNYAGRALIMSHNNEGDTVGTELTVQDIESVVQWLPEGHRETPYMEFRAWN
jgi:hypothetical protein